MSVRGSVFNSSAEKGMYQSLRSQWGSVYDVFPSVPFANIIDVDKVAGLTDAERSFLLHTSVDFTLCEKDSWRPIMSIEFDGVSHGFSKDGRYVPVLAEPKRAWRLDLKVRVATQVGYPFFVVSWHEKSPIDSETHLTIVDGIIGQVLAHQALPKILDRLLAEAKDRIAGAPPHLRAELEQEEQELVFDAEMLATLEHNPIARRASELEWQLAERGLFKGRGSVPLFDPELPDLPCDCLCHKFLEAFKARVEAFEGVRRVGCKMILHTAVGDVQETVWVNNIELISKASKR